MGAHIFPAHLNFITFHHPSCKNSQQEQLTCREVPAWILCKTALTYCVNETSELKDDDRLGLNFMTVDNRKWQSHKSKVFDQRCEIIIVQFNSVIAISRAQKDILAIISFQKVFQSLFKRSFKKQQKTIESVLCKQASFQLQLTGIQPTTPHPPFHRKQPHPIDCVTPPSPDGDVKSSLNASSVNGGPALEQKSFFWR